MNPDTTQPPVQLINGSHYGAYKSPADDRDHSLAAYAPVATMALPVSYYPNMEGINVWMQNKLGACVGHAAGKSQQVCRFHDTGAILPLSARFLYAMAKTQDGSTEEGTYPRIVASVMKNTGCATEATCPNDTTLDHATYCYNFKAANIPAAALAEATKVKISNYAWADISEQGIKSAIQIAGENKGGVFMLVKIGSEWWTAPDGRISWTAADVLPLRVPQNSVGGHEIYPYAFDEKNGRTIIIFRNSWSTAWGNNGDGWFFLDEWLPYIVEVITTLDLDPNYTAAQWHYTFKQALHQGMSGTDVVALQHALKIDGEFPAGVNFTGYFGQTTLAAVKAFQAKYASEVLTPAGLTEPTGFVGSYTLKKLNSLFSM